MAGYNTLILHLESIIIRGGEILTSEQVDELIAEWNSSSTREKTEVFAAFLKEYGEHAGWEEWLVFLQERPELEGFGWARSLAGIPSS